LLLLVNQITLPTKFPTSCFIVCPVFRLSDKYFAYVVGRNREFKFIKHVAWCPRSAGHHMPHMLPPIVAVALASGQVALTSFSQGHDPDYMSILGPGAGVPDLGECKCATTAIGTTRQTNTVLRLK
jgi:hypothetical protein